MEAAGLIGNKFFANPVSISGRNISDQGLEPGSYLFSSAQAEGLTSYSGILFVSGSSNSTQVRIVVGKDVFAFKRSDNVSWTKLV